MRILFCNYEYPPLGGGGGVVNAALATELAKRHDVTVLTSRALGLPAESVEGNVRVIRVPVLFRRRHAVANFPSMLAYVIAGVLRGRALVRAEEFDVVNTHFALPTGPVGHMVSRAAGVPNVLSVHGGDLYDPSKFSSAHRHASLRACVSRLARAADRVVAQSLDTEENLRHFFAPDVKAEVIPLGIAEPPVTAAARRDHGFGDDDVLLVSIGRLVRRKSVEHLLDVVAELRDERVKLLLIGDGPQLPFLRDQARRLRVESRVRFLGMVDERTKFELLSISDIYVSASQHEGFGLVFLEAMASGVPVICYDRGGQRDFLTEGRNGHLVARNDKAALVEACRRLIAAPEQRAEMGRVNRQDARQFYIDRCARRYEELFESVIRARAMEVSPAEGAEHAAGSAK
ncbi:MAG: glycosyltransferase family 4 protein [Gammaproteobacteria bacterium]|nr:glycosyltransferase family 4 protein [Gammaproteobacteria bacterium]